MQRFGNLKFFTLATALVCATSLSHAAVDASVEDLVQSHATDVYPVKLDAGSPVLVYLSGDGDTDLDLSLVDSRGGKVCQSQDDSDNELCVFVPEEEGTYRILVINHGRMSNQYALLIMQD
ncbi:MAG: PPC domain-containing protein [Burkholderiales bacterium]